MATISFSTAGLDTVRVGDWIAPLRRMLHENEIRWTGTLLKVSKVTSKRFLLGGGRWIDKATGRSVGGGGMYMLATPDMIADVEHRKQVAAKADQQAGEFRARPDHQYATNIWIILDEMTPDRHPLDRLTLEEWAAFYRKLAGKEHP